MSTFYDNYIKLCASCGKKPTTVSKEIGLSNAAASGWKNGKKPSAITKQRLADYFGISVSELTGEEQKEKPSGLPAGLDATQYTPEQLEVLNAVTKKIQTEEGCQDMYNLLKAMHIL